MSAIALHSHRFTLALKGEAIALSSSDMRVGLNEIALILVACLRSDLVTISQS
ncbi:hypothetical protein PN498_01445 [Oscillatoria sp. CS-180]|uniref:hypothetical protein n=1 Tax=Oscillatoria sp. CS-180 TaxID=3021720 RepID=UPI00232D52C4|nr:hypothetical protein [Oscillatoria sp. CS-180]MDB9524638.1 hypothetical protein [Oscillatoria sp. CS-180]